MNPWEQALTNVCRGPRVKEKRAEFKLAKQFHPKEHSKKPSSTWHKWSPLYLTEKLPAEVQRGHRGSDRKMPSGWGWPQGRMALAPFSRSWFSLESGRTERNHAVATSVSWGGRSREKQIQSNCGNLVHEGLPPSSHCSEQTRGWDGARPTTDCCLGLRCSRKRRSSLAIPDENWIVGTRFLVSWQNSNHKIQEILEQREWKLPSSVF